MSKLEQHSCWLEHTALSKANTKPNFLQEKKKQHEKNTTTTTTTITHSIHSLTGTSTFAWLRMQLNFTCMRSIAECYLLSSGFEMKFEIAVIDI